MDGFSANLLHNLLHVPQGCSARVLSYSQRYSHAPLPVCPQTVCHLLRVGTGHEMRLYNSHRHYDRGVTSVIVNKVITGCSANLKREHNKSAFQWDAYRPLQWPYRGRGGGGSAYERLPGGGSPRGCLPRGISAHGWGGGGYLSTTSFAEGNKVNKYQCLMVPSHLRFITRSQKMGAQPIIEPNDIGNYNRNGVASPRCEWTLIARSMVAKRGHIFTC